MKHSDKNTIDRIARFLSAEEGVVSVHKLTATGKKLDKIRNNIAKELRNISTASDVSVIIAIERRILNGDLLRYANSKAMESSLKTAINEIAAIEWHLTIVDDPVRYGAVNKDHSLPKNRKGGLPLDEARQAFVSHHARLNNMDKSRLSDMEKAIIEARKTALRRACKLYTERQAKTLGIDLNVQDTPKTEPEIYFAAPDKLNADTRLPLPVYNTINKLMALKKDLQLLHINQPISFYSIPEKLATIITTDEGKKCLLFDTNTVKNAVKLKTEAENSLTDDKNTHG